MSRFFEHGKVCVEASLSNPRLTEPEFVQNLKFSNSSWIQSASIPLQYFVNQIGVNSGSTHFGRKDKQIFVVIRENTVLRHYKSFLIWRLWGWREKRLWVGNLVCTLPDRQTADAGQVKIIGGTKRMVLWQWHFCNFGLHVARSTSEAASLTWVCCRCALLIYISETTLLGLEFQQCQWNQRPPHSKGKSTTPHESPEELLPSAGIHRFLCGDKVIMKC